MTRPGDGPVSEAERASEGPAAHACRRKVQGRQNITKPAQLRGAKGLSSARIFRYCRGTSFQVASCEPRYAIRDFFEIWTVQACAAAARPHSLRGGRVRLLGARTRPGRS